MNAFRRLFGREQKADTSLADRIRNASEKTAAFRFSLNKENVIDPAKMEAMLLAFESLSPTANSHANLGRLRSVCKLATDPGSLERDVKNAIQPLFEEANTIVG